MASNYSNYFFVAKTNLPSYDEYVYGLNYYTGSSVATGSDDPWLPITGSAIVVGKVATFDNYVFSPKSHGNMRDTFYSPPYRYVYTGQKESSPPVSIFFASSSLRLSSNQDPHSRIFSRFNDVEATEVPGSGYYVEFF
jgi:hypothetical protein